MSESSITSTPPRADYFAYIVADVRHFSAHEATRHPAGTFP